jgi:proton-dependent oligopeptide transporter, POT family
MSDRGFFGHPSGLSTLFFTEMWERFSFYGMRAILFLYMTAELAKGGLGWKPEEAAPIYALYASSVYFLPLIGGWIADRFIGAKRATLVGGIIIMCGHFSLAFAAMPTFYLGLILVAVGTGFLKSNISAMVGHLYEKDDVRRDAGFSVFYMGINLGAFISPLVCGYLAQSDGFRQMLTGWGINPNSGWHFGFAMAGIGMFFGLLQYVIGAKNLSGVGESPKRIAAINEKVSTTYIAQMIGLIVIAAAIIGFVAYTYNATTALKTVLMPTVLIAGLLGVLFTGMQDKLSTDDWKRIGVIIILFFFSMLFWMGFEQAATSFSLFAEELTDNKIFGWAFPASWMQSVNALMIIILAPVFSWIWLTLGRKQPSDPKKFVIGLLFGGLGFVVVAYAASLTGMGKVSPLWLCLVYLFHTIGELCLSPVGLSSMTKLAPAKMTSLMLGVWFLSVSMGNYAAGMIAGEFVNNPAFLFHLFGQVAMILIGGAFVLSLIAPFAENLARRREA